MIYTVTCNPSLDYIVAVDDFRPGYTNRTSFERIVPGGKGLNVSMVLGNLGIDSTALGFAAGFTGEEIIRQVEAMGVKADFIRIPQGLSRINLKLKSVEGTEINGGGPVIDACALEELMGRLEVLEAGDLLVLAGSVPGSLPEDIYKRMMERLAGRGVRMVVDAEKRLLVSVLGLHPFLVKPNHHELGEIFGVEIRTRKEALFFAEKLREMGAANVLVSMAGEGAVLAAEDGSIHQSPAPEGKLVNGVGAGDSMVAGFLAGFLEQREYSHAFYMGIAAGSASAYSEGMATREEIVEMYRRLRGGPTGNLA